MSGYREEMEPLLSVMVKPRETFRYMIENKKFTYALYTGAIAGIASMLITMYGSKFPAGFTLGDVVYSSIVSGVMFFMLTNLIMAYVMTKFGKALKGTGSFKDMFQTICMANAPYFWAMPILMFWLQYASHTFFKFDFPVETSLKDALWSYVGLFSVAVAAIWSFILNLVGISEAHKISKLKAFILLMIGGFFIFFVNFVLLVLF